MIKYYVYDICLADTQTHIHPSDSQTWIQHSYQYFTAAFPKLIYNLKLPSLKG